LNINYNLISKYLITLLSIVLIAFLIDTIVFLYLPKDKPSLQQNNINVLEYKRYELQSAFKVEKKIKKKIVQKKKAKVEYKFLSNMILSAIYDMGSEKGFIIIQEKGKSQTHILSIDEKFKGYTLYKIFAKYVIFKKFGKEFKLSISQDDKKVKYKEIETPSNISYENEIKNGDIEVLYDKVKVKRTLINEYAQNFDKVWDDIAINEVRTKEGIDGFKVNFIRKNSVFEKLGLKKNDVIKSANNIELKSYNDAIKLYKKMGKLKILNLKIIRNNQEEELSYEIK